MDKRCLQSLLSRAVLLLVIVVVQTTSALTPDDLTGRDYLSIKVTENGNPKTLVEGTRIALQFRQDDASGQAKLGVSAGCNSIDAGYTLDDEDKIITSYMATTEMACQDERMEQDAFIVAFFGSKPQIVLKDEEKQSRASGAASSAVDNKILQLSTDTVVMEFLDRKVADPDRPLIGPMWDVEAFIDGMGVTSMFVDKTGWIQFHPESGQFSFFDGCSPDNQETTGTFTVSEEDKTITFSNVDQVTCDGEGNVLEYSRRFYKLFETGAATYTIKGPTLQLENANEVGVNFRTDAEPDSTGSNVRCPGVTAQNGPGDDGTLSAASPRSGLFNLGRKNIATALLYALSIMFW